MKRSWLGVLMSGVMLCLIASEVAFAGSQAALSSLQFGVGGRASGMGEAFAGLADDAEAIFYNPAGLSNLNEREFIAAYSPLSIEGMEDSDMYQIYLAYAHPLNKWGTLGVGFFRMNSGKHQITADEHLGEIEVVDTVETYEGVYILSYSYPFTEKFFIGINGKYLYDHLPYPEPPFRAETTGAKAVDIGLLWYTPIKGLRIGLNWENYGEKMAHKDPAQADKLPGNLKYGFSYKVWEDKNNRVVVAGDINKYQVVDRVPINFGIEWAIANSLFARLGYFHKDGRFDGLKWEEVGKEDRKGLTWGFGLKYGSFQFDFASVPGGNLYGRISRAALSARF